MSGGLKFPAMDEKVPKGAIVHCTRLWGQDYETFITWQQAQPGNRSPHKGFFSSAEEFYRFSRRDISAQPLLFDLPTLSSLFKQQSLKEKEKKPECGHVMHAHLIPDNYCPVCQVDHCLEFLYKIKRAWVSQGGPIVGDVEQIAITLGYVRLKNAWHGARLELLQLVEKLEKQAIVDARTAEVSPTAPNGASYVSVRDAKMALERYHKEYQYPLSAPLGPKTEEPSGPLSLVSPTWATLPKLKKRVQFAEDVEDFAVRDNHTYLRRDPSYVPGRHAAPQGFEWVNGALTDNFMATLQQCKMFITDDAQFERYARDDTHWPEFEGVAGDHPRWEEIWSAFSQLSETLPPKQFEAWKETSKRHIDGIAVVENGGKFVQFVFLSAKQTKPPPKSLRRWASWVSTMDASG